MSANLLAYRRPGFVWLFLVMMLVACSGGSHTDSQANSTSSGPKAVATGLPDIDAQNIYVSHRYRLVESAVISDRLE